MLKGIDVSVHNNIIDWAKVKSQIDFAILRIGYGDNVSNQDDKRFYQNLKGCVENNIPFAVYLYSYATSREHLDSEILHTKRILESINEKPFCVYFDMEDNSTEFLGKDELTDYALTYCREIKKLGYKTGVYANQNWFNNYLDCKKIHNEGNSIWVAKYSDNKPNIPTEYDIWQYTSDGVLEGINGRVDMNCLYNDLILTDTTEIEQNSEKQEIDTTGVITYQAFDGIWLPEVQKCDNSINGYAGRFGRAISGLKAKCEHGEIFIQSHVIGSRDYLSKISSKDYYKNNSNSYSGIYNKPIDCIKIWSTIGWVKYRVHIKGGDWLPWVDSRTKTGSESYAGIYGKEIDAIQMY